MSDAWSAIRGWLSSALTAFGAPPSGWWWDVAGKALAGVLVTATLSVAVWFRKALLRGFLWLWRQLVRGATAIPRRLGERQDHEALSGTALALAKSLRPRPHVVHSTDDLPPRVLAEQVSWLDLGDVARIEREGRRRVLVDRAEWQFRRAGSSRVQVLVWRLGCEQIRLEPPGRIPGMIDNTLTGAVEYVPASLAEERVARGGLPLTDPLNRVHVTQLAGVDQIAFWKD